LSQLGSSGNQGGLVSAFTAGYSLASGQSGGDSPQTQQLLDAANRNGGLATSSQNLQDQMANLIDGLGGHGQQTNGGGGGDGSVSGAGNNWMEAIARAMGEALGNLSQKVVDE